MPWGRFDRHAQCIRGDKLDDAIYDFDEEESGAKPSRPGLPVEPRRLLRMLWAERKRLARMFLAVAAISVAASFFVPETFESNAILFYEGSPLLLEDGPRSQDAFVRSAIAPSRLQEVRARLETDIALSELEGRVEAEAISERSMRLGATGSTAEEAHTLAEALLEVFLAHQAEFNARKLKRLTAENKAALERAAKRRDAAQEAFNAFREKSGMPDLLDEKEQLLARAAQLRARADEAAVEVAAQRALIGELERAQNELPRQVVATATRGSAADAPLAKARAELAEARATLSDAHPRVQALEQQVASLKAQRGGQRPEVGEQTLTANPARAAVDEQLATARATLAGAEERRSALQVLLQNVQREAEALAPEEGEARQVLGELDASVARFDELTARNAALRDASLAPLTGFRVLSAPLLPEEPKPSKSAVAFLALLPFLAALIYAVVILVRGLRTLHVEAPREVAWWGNGPVLGTSVWPRDPDALDNFVDELEDQGVYGGGRTLVVPATETERDIACSFAMRLSEAPWLAAAILDVGDRSEDPWPLVTPAPHGDRRLVTPPPGGLRRRLSSSGTPSVARGRAVPHRPTVQGFVPPVDATSQPIVTPSPHTQAPGSFSSRPPRKKTVVGLPAVKGDGVAAAPIKPVSDPAPVSGEPADVPPQSSTPPSPSNGPEPFRRKRGARATVRMMVPAPQSEGTAETSRDSSPDAHEEAFLLTRPVPVSDDDPSEHVGPGVHIPSDAPRAEASNAVMRAAIRLLGSENDDLTELRRSEPPVARSKDEVTGVALAWNGPLSGPVLRRAARLAHRVMVVVSSGLSVVELARIQTRLGRRKGVGYVLVNLGDAYLDVADRVGPVEEFWRGEREAQNKSPWGG